MVFWTLGILVVIAIAIAAMIDKNNNTTIKPAPRPRGPWTAYKSSVKDNGVLVGNTATEHDARRAVLFSNTTTPWKYTGVDIYSDGNHLFKAASIADARHFVGLHNAKLV